MKRQTQRYDRRKLSEPNLPAKSKARLSLTLSPDEHSLIRKSSNDPDILSETVRLSIVEPNTFLLEGDDQTSLLRAASVLKALGLGFAKRDAVSLKDEANTLMMIPLKAELPPRDIGKKGRSPQQRLLAFQALNLRVIRNFTGVSHRIDNNQLWLLGSIDAVVEASRQVRQIARGRTRGTVQQYHRGKHGITIKRKGHL